MSDYSAEYHRCLRSLWYLATEFLGYDKLSETFHKPMLREWDLIDHRRFGYDPKSGLFDREKESIDTLAIWPRDHIKTWCERARVIRYYMFDPTWTHTWWHAVEEMASESGAAIGKTLQTNNELRKLFPTGVLPARNRVKFVTGGGFSLTSNRIGDAPSFRVFGAGSEAGGAHSRGGTLDDIIGLNDIVDSQMPAKKRWYWNTVCNVIRSEGFKDAIGTRWDREDIYNEWLNSKHWVSSVRSCLETDGKMDYKGEPVYLTKEQVEKKRDEMDEVSFAFQMMNDSTPSGLRAWDPTLCEHFVIEKEYRGGVTVCLSDPAPAQVGSFKNTQWKFQDGGTKNEWAITLWRLRTVGVRREAILLDGDASKEWDLDTGYRRIFAMMRKWGCTRLAEEATGQAIAVYEKQRRETAREEGARYHPVKLAGTYKGQAKKVYFAAFCAKAKNDEVLIADSVPTAFLDGMLDQLRNCVFVGDGFRNNLKLDDRMNVASFVTDPEVARISPLIEEAKAWSPYLSQEKEPEYSYETRHIRW